MPKHLRIVKFDLYARKKKNVAVQQYYTEKKKVVESSVGYRLEALVLFLARHHSTIYFHFHFQFDSIPHSKSAVMQPADCESARELRAVADERYVSWSMYISL